MIILSPAPIVPSVAARDIPVGMVFTGEINEDYHIRIGTFLKLHSHIVHLDTNTLIGCGALSLRMVKGYVAYSDSTLIVK